MCKKIFARKKIFAVHRLGSSWPWSRAGSRAVSGLFHVSLGIIKSALCLLCPPSRRQDTAVEGRQMQVSSTQVYSMSRYISTMEISILQLSVLYISISFIHLLRKYPVFRYPLRRYLVFRYPLLPKISILHLSI